MYEAKWKPLTGGTALMLACWTGQALPAVASPIASMGQHEHGDKQGDACCKDGCDCDDEDTDNDDAEERDEHGHGMRMDRKHMPKMGGMRMGPEVRYMPAGFGSPNQFLVLGGGMQHGERIFSMGLSHQIAFQLM